jgi:ubiquinone/menaquinone biosynthesis C-methylase UbiE
MKKDQDAYGEQEKGFDVTGIDNSAGAIKVCKMRGLKKALVRSIEEIDKFKPNSFDTIQMLGNNFGLFGSFENALVILEKMSRITSPEARIIALTLNPYMTDNPHHLAYLRRNKKLGRMGGQIKFRIRFAKSVGKWFDYLFVSPDEMKKIIGKSDWQIEKFINAEELHYAVILTKKKSA